MKYFGIASARLSTLSLLSIGPRFSLIARMRFLTCICAFSIVAMFPLASDAQGVPNSGPAKTSIRTITNDDLEPFRQARIAADKVDEIRRKELGLPSHEEIRRLQQEQDRRLAEMASRYQSEQLQAELRRTEAELKRQQYESEEEYPSPEIYDLQDTAPYVEFIPTAVGRRTFRGERFGRGERFANHNRFRRIYVAPRNVGPARR